MPPVAAGVVMVGYDFLHGGTLGVLGISGLLVLVLLGFPFLVCVSRVFSAVTLRESRKRRAAYERGTVETWTFTIDRAWWNLADEDCDARLLHTTDGRYVFIGTYEWLDIPQGDDESRVLSPTRIRAVDTGADLTLEALDEPSIPLESVPDAVPMEVHALPHFEVIVYEGGELPSFLRGLIT